MKKKYMQPEVAVEKLDVQWMIAASDDVLIDPTITGDPSNADSRLFEDFNLLRN